MILFVSCELNKTFFVFQAEKYSPMNQDHWLHPPMKTSFRVAPSIGRGKSGKEVSQQVQDQRGETDGEARD